MFALQTRDFLSYRNRMNEVISNLPQGKYIELSFAQHIDNKKIRVVSKSIETTLFVFFILKLCV